jgi:hypothetical protein
VLSARTDIKRALEPPPLTAIDFASSDEKKGYDMPSPEISAGVLDGHTVRLMSPQIEDGVVASRRFVGATLRIV